MIVRRFVDLSIYLENEVVSDPPMMKPNIDYIGHDIGAEQMAAFFPGLERDELPDGEGWAIEFVQLSTHNGTHLDAPYHFHPTMNEQSGEKERAITIDEVPLEWCFQPGVKLDFRHFADGYVVTAKDVETELERIRHDLSPLEIVVVNTAAGAAYGQADFVSKGCGMGYEATMFLLERGIRVTGTDAWSWDAPFDKTAERYAETGDAGWGPDPWEPVDVWAGSVDASTGTAVFGQDADRNSAASVGLFAMIGFAVVVVGARRWR